MNWKLTFNRNSPCHSRSKRPTIPLFFVKQKSVYWKKNTYLVKEWCTVIFFHCFISNVYIFYNWRRSCHIVHVFWFLKHLILTPTARIDIYKCHESRTNRSYIGNDIFFLFEFLRINFNKQSNIVRLAIYSHILYFPPPSSSNTFYLQLYRNTSGIFCL